MYRLTLPFCASIIFSSMSVCAEQEKTYFDTTNNMLIFESETTQTIDIFPGGEMRTEEGTFEFESTTIEFTGKINKINNPINMYFFICFQIYIRCNYYLIFINLILCYLLWIKSKLCLKPKYP